MTGVTEETVQASVRGYAADAMGTSPDRIVKVSRFEDGNRHAVFKVGYIDATGDERAVVVRISLGADFDEQRQAQREAKVLETTRGVAAPALYDFRLVNPWFATPAMCIQFIPGRPHDLTRATAAAMERLGAALASVHRRPTTDLAAWLPAADNVLAYTEDRLQSILAGLAGVRDPLPAALQVRLHAAAGVLERRVEAVAGTPAFSTAAPLSLLHGDPATDNILWSPDPVLIDWEYARLGDPADEIAYLFDQNELAALQRDAFWAGYQDSGSELTERVSWWEPVTLLGSTLWWVDRWRHRSNADAAGISDAEATRPPAYYLDRIIRRVDRLERLIS